MQVILTGSAGYVGSKVRTALEAEGVKVIPVDINNPDAPINLRTLGSLRNLGISGDYKLIHLAFPLPGKVPSKKFKRFVFEVNTNLLNEISPLETLLISSTAVYGLDHSVNEYSKISPWEIYGKLKLDTESIFKKKFSNLTIFRPGTLIEANREGAMMSFIKLLQNGSFVVTPGKGVLVHPFTHTDDLVEAITKWALSENTGFSEYTLTAAEPITLHDISGITDKKIACIFQFQK